MQEALNRLFFYTACRLLAIYEGKKCYLNEPSYKLPHPVASSASCGARWKHCNTVFFYEDDLLSVVTSIDGGAEIVRKKNSNPIVMCNERENGPSEIIRFHGEYIFLIPHVAHKVASLCLDIRGKMIGFGHKEFDSNGDKWGQEDISFVVKSVTEGLYLLKQTSEDSED